jgi:hypothetical protein
MTENEITYIIRGVIFEIYNQLEIFLADCADEADSRQINV